jgi:hypothetical protein
MNFLISKKGLSFQSIKTPWKSRSQQKFSDAYFFKKTFCPQPPDPYHWKAEALSFLHVLLVLGVNPGSLLTKSCQSYGIGSVGTNLRKGVD